MNSDQLVLALDDVRLKRAVEPWGGRSPRELTRGYESFIFRRKAGKSVSELVSGDQLELWPSDEEGPPVYRGAPLLLEPRGGMKNG